jgi:hypothetical protein
MFASRMFVRNGSNERAAQELTAPAAVNWFLDTVLGFERALIKLGLSFPIGGSLLMVGRRV